MSLTRIGKIALVLLFLAYLAILGETFRHRTGPTVSKEFPYLIFKTECHSDDSGLPESYRQSERGKGENVDSASVTETISKSAAKSVTEPMSVSAPKSEREPASMMKFKSPIGEEDLAAWSIAPTAKKFAQASETITYYPTTYSTTMFPIPSPTVTTWSTPSYYVTYSPPVVLPSTVIVERPFFQSFIP